MGNWCGARDQQYLDLYPNEDNVTNRKRERGSIDSNSNYPLDVPSKKSNQVTNSLQNK